QREGRTKPLFNSVTISKEPVPVTPTESTPNVVNGVVFWDGGEDLLSAKSFDIFVTGISNGYVQVEPEAGEEPVVRRKTLRLSFEKPGDIYHPDEKEIRTAQEPGTWIYR